MNTVINALGDPRLLLPLGKGLVIVFLAVVSFYVARNVMLKVIHRVAQRTRSTWDDILVEKAVFSALAFIAPAIVVYYGAKAFAVIPETYVNSALTLYLTLLALVLLGRLLDAGLAIYSQFPVAERRPIKGYVQLVKIFVYVVGAIISVAVLLGMSPWKLASGIGALTAVILLIFKDTILSLVASVQIASNDLLRPGDWIEMPHFGADGDVIDIALHTVKVQNWDMTIVSIPTNKFLDHSFKNWRGMSAAGGRRIKRALLVDQSSIDFLQGDVLERLKKIDLLKDYLLSKEQEIQAHNQCLDAGSEMPVNGRRLTNIGTLRTYAIRYLQQHPGIHQEMTLMVRQLAPRADAGLPLEVYAFSRTTDWNAYENIQADIFDHLLAVLPIFGLRAYQRNALPDVRSA